MKQQEFYSLLDSRENISILIQYLLDYPEQIGDIVDMGINDCKASSWRAIWIADKIHEKKPALIRPFIPQLIDALKSISNESKKRHVLKLISLNNLPDKHLPFLLDYCLSEFVNAERPVAIRVHAMQILYEISEAEPDFKPELIHLIEHEMEYHGSPGIKARGKKLVSRLSGESCH